jgi:hypothetical protein
MLKTYRGSAYIFADIGLEIAGTAPFDPDPGVCEEIDGTMACKAQGYNQTPGKKVFNLPRGVHGRRVRVVGEHRTIPVRRRSRTFTDRFATEHAHHVYRAPEPEGPASPERRLRLGSGGRPPPTTTT